MKAIDQIYSSIVGNLRFNMFSNRSGPQQAQVLSLLFAQVISSYCW